jgi:hypothetical protein
MRKLTIALAVLAGLLVGADRVSLFFAERTVGDTIQSSQHLQNRPDVDIAGFPFLTQLAARKLDEVTVTAHDVPLGNDANALRVSVVRADMHEVRIDFVLDRATVGTGTATALITYAELTRHLGVRLRYAGDGRVRASVPVSLGGHAVDVGVTARPDLVNGSLAFGGTSRDSGVPVDLLARLADALGAPIDLTGIPFGLRLQGLHADAAGVTVQLSGRNVTLQRQS